MVTIDEPDGSGLLHLSAGAASATVVPAGGARIGSLEVAGRELLVTEAASPYGWGIFPMVPFAGRIRRGIVRFRGHTYTLPTTLPPHAIHGTLSDATWTVLGAPRVDHVVLTAALGAPWPFRGRVIHRVRLEPSALHASLELDAEEPMPAWVGWHPWFRRSVEGARDEVELRVEPGWMLARDGEGIPAGERVRPGPRPWDDAFTGLREAPRLRWPGVVELTVESSCRYWVIYDEEPHGICVEPQTAPPDSVNWMPEEAVLVEPGRPLIATLTLRWKPDGGAGR